MSELLPWLNLLLVPSVALLGRISAQLATLQAVQREHERRIGKLESGFGELGRAIRT